MLFRSSVEILADRGLSARVAPEQWAAICRAMEARFGAGEFERGALEGLEAVSALLAAHFPADGPNANELPDRPLLI